jgi:hypothetical protein
MENNDFDILNINKNREKGYIAFFRDDNNNNLRGNEINILFPEYIQARNFEKFSNELKEKRNYMIYICAFQILASLIGMAYVIYRRSYIYLFINLLTLALAFCGGYGVLLMNYLYILVHCILTISLPGAFFLYQIVDFFIAPVPVADKNGKKRASEALIFFIFSLPYLYDLAAGAYCFFFIKLISKNLMENNLENERLKENFMNMKQKYSKEDIDNHIKNINNDICVICMDKKRDTALTPCGHYLCCQSCAKELFDNYHFTKPRCPICRKECNNFVKIIIS